MKLLSSLGVASLLQYPTPGKARSPTTKDKFIRLPHLNSTVIKIIDNFVLFRCPKTLTCYSRKSKIYHHPFNKQLSVFLFYNLHYANCCNLNLRTIEDRSETGVGKNAPVTLLAVFGVTSVAPRSLTVNNGHC